MDTPERSNVMVQQSKVSFVSIIIPCRNEEKFIAKCLDSIINNDYTKERLEVLLVNGMSEDKTREIVQEYTQQYSFIRLLDNPKKITPVALNIGIKHAKGEIIMRMDAHTTYEKDYISKCVKYLGEYNADNVGGLWKIVPRDNTIVGKAIALASSHPLGGGNAYYRVGSEEPRWVDTVPFGCYKKEVFERIGLYNEELARSQDMEFNLRMKRAGGKILLHPEIVSYYYTRSNLKAIFKHRFVDGIWAIYPLKFVSMPFSWRHYVPLVFVSSLIGSAALSVFSQIFLWLFLFILGSYALTNVYFSVKITAKEKDFRYLFWMPIMFATLHIGYGLGSLWGLLKVIMSAQFWKNRFS
jgi:glycosyltransferase involved in cell wall biosynthesis